MEGTVCNRGHIARLTPVFKEGNNALTTDYSLISLTRTCSKLLEYIISNYMINFLDEHNVLSPFQHGFHKGLSAIPNLFFVSILSSLSLINQAKPVLYFLILARLLRLYPTAN